MSPAGAETRPSDLSLGMEGGRFGVFFGFVICMVNYDVLETMSAMKKLEKC